MDESAYIEMARTEGTHWWFKARREIIDSVIGSLGLPQGARILEVGAGTGGNLAMLSQHGHLSAMELDWHALQIARAKAGGPYAVVRGRCPDDIPFREGAFDLVCMFDVLEHIEQDQRTLGALRDQLAPGGSLLLTVPAYQWLWSAHDVHLHHYRRYTATRLREVLTAGGYRVSRVTYFNSFLFPLAALARLADNVRHRTVASGTELPSRFINALLYRVFRSEQLWLRRRNLPFGVSLMSIA